MQPARRHKAQIAELDERHASDIDEIKRLLGRLFAAEEAGPETESVRHDAGFAEA